MNPEFLPTIPMIPAQVATACRTPIIPSIAPLLRLTLIHPRRSGRTIPQCMGTRRQNRLVSSIMSHMTRTNLEEVEISKLNLLLRLYPENRHKNVVSRRTFLDSLTIAGPLAKATA